MKGLVFTQLQDFVEENHGLEIWDKAIESTPLPSEGLYVSTRYYDDNEILLLVSFFCSELNVSSQVLLNQFGIYLFPNLFDSLPNEMKVHTSLRSFLHSVESIIHVEVLKLNPDASLPSFEYHDGEKSLTMIYHSSRKLCFLAEGLILGAAELFNQKISIKHPKCMHNDCEFCVIEVHFDA